MLLSALLLSSLAGAFADAVLRGPVRQPAKRGAAPLTGSAAAMIAKRRDTTNKDEDFDWEERTYRSAFVGLGASMTLAAAVPAAAIAVPAVAAFGLIPLVRMAASQYRRNGALDIQAGYAALGALLLATQSFLPLMVTEIAFWAHVKLNFLTRDRSQRAITNLFGGDARTAWVVVGDAEAEVALNALKVGDLVVVRAGEHIPVDGVIVSGAGQVDQRALTGEEQPIELGPDDSAFASTVLLNGRLVVRASRAGTETTAGRIVAMLDRTTEYRLSMETRARRVANASVPVMLGAAVLVLPFIGPYATASLLVTFPAPDVLLYAAPLGMLHLLRQAAKRGMAIMDGRTLEMMRDVDTVVFDKTGTLTRPIPAVVAVWSSGSLPEGQLLAWAAAAERQQEHPAAHAIRAEAQRRGMEVPVPEMVDTVIGYGIRARIKGVDVLVGSARFMASMHVRIGRAAKALEDNARALGDNVIHLACDGKHAGAITLRPELRPEAIETVAALRASGLHVRILSGDGEVQTASVARLLGVDGYDAGVLPHEKSEAIRRLRQEGRFVCFVGDGINDVVAMREAQVSIAVAGAPGAARAVAGIIVYDDNLRHIPDMLRMGREFHSRSTQALAASLLPKLLGSIAVLAGGIGYFGAVVVDSIAFGAAVGAMVRPWRGGTPTKALPRQPRPAPAILPPPDKG